MSRAKPRKSTRSASPYELRQPSAGTSSSAPTPKSFRRHVAARASEAGERLEQRRPGPSRRPPASRRTRTRHVSSSGHGTIDRSRRLTGLRTTAALREPPCEPAARRSAGSPRPRRRPRTPRRGTAARRSRDERAHHLVVVGELADDGVRRSRRAQPAHERDVLAHARVQVALADAHEIGLGRRHGAERARELRGSVPRPSASRRAAAPASEGSSRAGREGGPIAPACSSAATRAGAARASGTGTGAPHGRPPAPASAQRAQSSSLPPHANAYIVETNARRTLGPDYCASTFNRNGRTGRRRRPATPRERPPRPTRRAGRAARASTPAGVAEKVPAPNRKPCSPVGSRPSQTCSGSIPAAVGGRGHRRELGGGRAAREQLVLAALAGEDRPRAAERAARIVIEQTPRLAVAALAVAVEREAVPERAGAELASRRPAAC